MGKNNSSLLNSVYVPMIGCFVAGVVVSRLMNHQDVVTGDVKEGDTWWNPKTWSSDTGIDVVFVTIIIIIIIVSLAAAGWMIKTGDTPEAATARKLIFFWDVDPKPQ